MTLTITRGDTEQFTITVTRDSSAFDLTGYTVKITVKENQYDSDSNAVIGPKECTVSDAAGGIATVTLSSTETSVVPGTYYYDVQINNGSTVYTVINDTFVVTGEVTKSYS